MSASSTETKSLKRYDGRLIVPVIGSGFNRWLLGKAVESSVLTDWWKLLQEVARVEGLLPDPALEEKLRVCGDASFAWEALVGAKVARVVAEENGQSGLPSETRGQSSKAENKLLKALAALLKDAERDAAQDVQGATARWETFRKAVWPNKDAGGDLLSLNFSIPGCPLPARGSRKPSVAPLWRAPDGAAGVERDGNVAGPLTIPTRVMDGHPRIWFPHGSRLTPSSMVLGTHRYTRSAAYVVDAFKRFKAVERRIGTAGKTGDARFHNAHRHESVEKLSWVGAAINAPLLLLGVGLARAEVDLWEFLHLRARNHARLDPKKRPPIWRLTCGEEKRYPRTHWRSLAAGIQVEELCLGDTWDKAWENLLAELRSLSGRFGD